jgi:sn-glycerol 3-phosphate transport system ATP-binding protein
MIYVTHDQVEAMTMADRIIVMNAVRIEQIGTPAEIYHTPATTFVASFMGAPPMNLLDGQIVGSTAQIGELMLGAAPAAVTGPVTIGLRPEDIVLDAEGALSLEVAIVEELGAHRLLHGTISGQSISVHVSKDIPATTGTVRVTLKPNALSFFTPDSGLRL